MSNSSVKYENRLNLLSNLFKGLIVSIIITFVCIIIFGFVIKWGSYPNSIITPVNLAIKGLSVIIGAFIYGRHASKGIIRGIIFGLAYTTLAFLIFSLLSGSMLLSTGILLDYAFTITASIIATIISINTSK